MSIIEFIILAIALSFEAMIVMHGCALKTPIRLTQGLAESITIAAVNALLLLLGIWMNKHLWCKRMVSPLVTCWHNLINISGVTGTGAKR